MHTLNRLLAITALLLVAVTFAMGGSMLGSLLPAGAEERFAEALDQAKEGYRESATFGLRADRARKTLDVTTKQLLTLGKKKRELRLAVAALRAKIRGAEAESDALINTEVRSVTRMHGEKERLAEFMRGGFVQLIVADAGGSPARLLGRRILGQSMGEQIEDELRDEALTRAQAQVLTSLLQARETSVLSQAVLHEVTGDLGRELSKLEAERERVLKEYRTADRLHLAAGKQLRVSEEEMAEVLRETAQVQDDILRMQGEMAQIEGRLRARAERELIQKGLRTAQPGRYSEQAASTSFVWPVKGVRTAGYHDASYLSYFGVPHRGQDIAVPQGTEVAAAADGIVFLARDGGQRGFSYILIGHRGGYATLYGHLSSFSVTTGQEVRQGQTIGLSGGRPGTHGAGPMTTGPHLHFEVIKNGVHADPESVLP